MPVDPFRSIQQFGRKYTASEPQKHRPKVRCGIINKYVSIKMRKEFSPLMQVMRNRLFVEFHAYAGPEEDEAP